LTKGETHTASVAAEFEASVWLIGKTTVTASYEGAFESSAESTISNSFSTTEEISETKEVTYPSQAS
jgi:isocitrate dehydrogenase